MVEDGWSTRSSCRSAGKKGRADGKPRRTGWLIRETAPLAFNHHSNTPEDGKCMVGNRRLSRILGALFERRHYVALRNMGRLYPDFGPILFRYLSAKGTYPYRCEIRTPSGLIRPTLYSHHDLLTVNEIFCRQDYLADDTSRVVVDIGSNIGISALYFLTRGPATRCYLYEPDPRNVRRLEQNLAGLETRFVLHRDAVSDVGGRARFGVEPTGRYGGLTAETGEYMEVECLGINDILETILAREGAIDILKVDSEGVEISTVRAIKPEHASRIGHVYLEAKPGKTLLPETHSQEQYGQVCRLTNLNPAFRSSGPVAAT
jgi:FkbM family methyltransferase